jgi:hypothetical protein
MSRCEGMSPKYDKLPGPEKALPAASQERYNKPVMPQRAPESVSWPPPGYHGAGMDSMLFEC